MSTYPTVRPSLTLDFQKSKQLDPRITFSRSSTATYVEGGVIKTADEHQARFEKDGLLIEESRVNYTPESTYVAAKYEGTNTTPTGSQIAPDGTSSAALWTENSSTSIHTVREKTLWSSSSAGDNHTWSVFVKPNGRTKCRLYTGQTTTVTYDLTTNTVSPSADGTITPYANGWYRISTTSVNSSGGNLFHYIYFLNDSGAQNYAGDGSSGMYVWGWQVEGNESFSTSYIPTAGSTVTRAADLCTIKGDQWLDIWASNNQSIVAQGNIKYTVSNTTFPASFAGPNLYTLDGRNAVWNKVWYSYVENTGRGTVDGTGGAGGTREFFHPAVTQKTGTFKSCMTFDTDNDRLNSAWNTVLSNEATAGTFVEFWRNGTNPGMTIGGKNTANRTPWNGTVSRIVIYSVAMTDTQLETLTL